MRKIKRNWLLSLCGALAAFGLFTGIWACTPSVETAVNAAGAIPTITMVTGASARKVAGETGIKFTAKIDGYSTDFKYGMLILPESAWTNGQLAGYWETNGYYHGDLADEGITNFADCRECTPYQRNGEWYISFALKNLQNYNMSFVGVAYSYTDVDDFDTYNYADVDWPDFAENGRSMSYVAQMALKYDEALTSSEKSALKGYTSGNISIEEEDYLTDENANAGGTTVKKEADYAMKYHPNVNDALAFVSKTAYAEGSVLSFDYYIPAGGPGGWWGIAWNNNKDNATNYDTAGEQHAKVYQGHQSLDAKTTGAWFTATVTLTSEQADGNFYFYIGSDCGSWKLADGSDSYILLDNFKINGTIVEDFASGDLLKSNIEVKDASRVSIEKIRDAEISFGESGKIGEYAAKLDFTNSFNNQFTTFLTKEAVAKGGDTVSFKYYIPEETTIGEWWSLSWTNDLSNGENFWAVGEGISTGLGGVNPGKIKGEWVDYSVTMAEDSSAYWLYFCGYKNWNGCVYIDDFKVTRNGEVVVEENFHKGIKESIFNYNVAYVSDGEGYVLQEKGELAMKYNFNVTDLVSMITSKAYAEGSTVSFKYYIPSTVSATSWWGIAWNTVAGNANNYHAAGVEKNYQGNYACSQVVGEWTEVSFTINSADADGDFYLYFGFNYGAWEGSDLYILIDDFTVNGKTETFNFGLEESIFLVKEPSAVTEGAGFGAEVENPETPDVGGEEELAMKYIFNVSGETVSQVTKQAYAGGSTVSFKYYIPEGTPTSWWGLAYKTSNTGLRIYDAADSSKAYAVTGSNTVTGSWVDVSFTLPSGGPYYLYFGSEVSASNWKLDGENSYMLIDEFTINDEKETFNYGVENSIFAVLVADAVSEGEGYTPPPPSAYGAKLLIDKISSTKTTPSFITESTYAGGVTITFDYYISGNTNNKWWSFCWTADNKDASIYAHTGNYNAFGQTIDATVQNTWCTASIDVPAGNWYFYIGGAVGEWSGGYVIIDNFRIGDVITETFDDGTYGIFLDNRDSKPEAITIAEGKVDFVPGEYSAEFAPDSNNTEIMPLITKDAYAGGSVVYFKYYIDSTNVASDNWWGIAYNTSNSGVSIYDAAGANKFELSKITGRWVEQSFTLPAGGPYYLYFGACVGGWNGKIRIDDFQVTSGGTVYSENFNEHKDNWLLTPGSIISYGEGAPVFEPGEYSAELNFAGSTSNNPADFITKEAYVGGSVITFKYMVPTTTKVNSWWSFSWSTVNNNKDDFWMPSGRTVQLNNSTNGQWVEQKVTLPNDGNYYYLYFCVYGEGTGVTGPVYVDDFQIVCNTGIIKEDFNNAAAGWIFAGNFSYVTYGKGCEEVLVDYGKDTAAQINVDKFTGDKLAEFVTKDSYAAGSVVSFEYFIPTTVTFKTSSTWWTLCVTTNLLNADVYSNRYATMTKVQGEWTTVSVTLDRAGYIYFAGAIGEWNGGCVYIRNFSVTTDGETVTDTFRYGVDGGLFMVNSNNGAIMLEEKASKLGVNPDPYAFENLLKDEANLSDVLENGGYASLISEVEVDETDLPVSSLLIEGFFDYTITGEKEFAVYFGNNYYIYINAESIALYNGKTKVKEIAGSVDATFYLAVTVGGKIAVRINDGGYVGLGSMHGAATMVKVVALGGDGNIQFANFNIVTYKCNWLIEDDIPLYVSEEQIDFTAYAYDSDAMVSDAGFQLLSEAGFTKTLALLQGRAAGVAEGTKVTDDATIQALMEEVNKDAHKALELAEKYGMKQYVMNIGLYNLMRAKQDDYSWIQKYSDAATYLMSEAYAGHFFADEPHFVDSFIYNTENEMDDLLKAYRAYKTYFPDGDAYINLLPCGSTEFTTKSKYKDYVDTYIEQIAKDYQGVKGTGFVSFDMYPLKSSSIETNHLWNLEYVATRCKEEGLELRYYIKASTTGDGSLRAVQSVNDIYVQLYAGLVYGGKEIIYYNFTDHTTKDGTAGDGVISGYSLEKGNVYNWAKQANNEIAAFSAAYMNFTWNSASISGSCTQFNQLASKVSIGSHGSLSGVSSSAKVLIGNFTDSDGKYTHGAQHAYMAMNYGDPRNGNTGESSMTFTFSGKSRALVYENGKPTVYTLSSNQLTLNLQVGEGAFIIPLN